MKYFRDDIACCILFSLSALTLVRADWQDVRSLQRKAVHLPETKFGVNEYSEYSENEDRDGRPSPLQWNQVPMLNHNERIQKIPKDPQEGSSDILWDSSWKPNVEFGQISAVSIDPAGNIGIFHRGARIWGIGTFDTENKFNPANGPVRENTIVLLNKSGQKIAEWGRNMFYLPHGLTIDSHGHYWVTDVALHQVFKFNADDIRKHLEEEARSGSSANKMLHDETLEPSLTLGQAFVPGNDDRTFCKPTAVAVDRNGEFFVSDGYCNSRVIKFNAKGERILQWGRHWEMTVGRFVKPPPHYAFLVPHALALAHELNYILVADRENGRVLCFFASNGTFHKEYKHPAIGTKVYSIAYAREKLYLINGPDPAANIHVRGFVLDIDSGDIASEFTPRHDMERPHDLAVTENGSEIYVVELDSHVIYRFSQDVNSSVQRVNTIAHVVPHHEPAPLTDTNSDLPPTGGTATATLVLSLVSAAVIFIALCVAIAAVVARCQKRGRLFQYDESAVEFSKLVE